MVGLGRDFIIQALAELSYGRPYPDFLMAGPSRAFMRRALILHLYYILHLAPFYIAFGSIQVLSRLAPIVIDMAAGSGPQSAGPGEFSYGGHRPDPQ